jgi:hypothetical protein
MNIAPILTLLLLFSQITTLFGGVPEDSIHGEWGFTFVEAGFTRSGAVYLGPKGEYEERGWIADIVNGEEQGKRIWFRIQGRWELVDDSVVVTVIKSNAPKYIQAGSIIKFKIFKVTESDITYINTATNKVYKAPKIDEP